MAQKVPLPALRTIVFARAELSRWRRLPSRSSLVPTSSCACPASEEAVDLFHFEGIAVSCSSFCSFGIPSHRRHDLSEFYKGGLEKEDFLKLNVRRPGGAERTNIEPQPP